MNRSAHQITGCIIDQPMAGDGVFAGKDLGDDVDMVMPAAAASAGMASVQMRVVTDGECVGVERSEAPLQFDDGLATHAGSTFLNGLTVTFS